MIDVSEQYQRRAGILSTESDGETILVRLSDGRFFGLGETGTLIWDRLAQPCTMTNLMEALKIECVSLSESAAGEMVAFFVELQREGLIEPAAAILDQTPAGALGQSTGEKHMYTAPRLDRGTLRQAASGNTGSADAGLTTGGLTGGLS